MTHTLPRSFRPRLGRHVRRISRSLAFDLYSEILEDQTRVLGFCKIDSAFRILRRELTTEERARSDARGCVRRHFLSGVALKRVPIEFVKTRCRASSRSYRADDAKVAARGRSAGFTDVLANPLYENEDLFVLSNKMYSRYYYYGCKGSLSNDRDLQAILRLRTKRHNSLRRPKERHVDVFVYVPRLKPKLPDAALRASPGPDGIASIVGLGGGWQHPARRSTIYWHVSAAARGGGAGRVATARARLDNGRPRVCRRAGRGCRRADESRLCNGKVGFYDAVFDFCVLRLKKAFAFPVSDDRSAPPPLELFSPAGEEAVTSALVKSHHIQKNMRVSGVTCDPVCRSRPLDPILLFLLKTFELRLGADPQLLTIGEKVRDRGRCVLSEARSEV
ncbi:hypothetical protein EVAR_85646_1 [Eumeta japonica]|uniref:Uncharacterized protein n=1 Tax=Eumeta variegata TaxID=151549 RepID=A0A4C1XW50_EUMVA|nr:hypothetical protein EVAR_85646_1 [Eumeta japonica]